MEVQKTETQAQKPVSYTDRVAVAVGVAMVSGGSFAAAGDFDVSAATGALGGVMVAVAAIGAVKIAPAAAAWAWSLLTRTASR
jgi:hypothetical protein